MQATRRICLCGNSVILGTVGASLRRSPGLKVVSLASASPDERDLEALAPNAVLFDLEAQRPEAAFALLNTLPDLLIVGLSPDSNVVRLWSGRQLRELSTGDLLKTINDQLENTLIP